MREASSSKCAEEEEDRTEQRPEKEGREDLSHTGIARGGRKGGIKQGEGERKPERRREQRGNRQPGSGPGLSLAKVEAFASCQLETAALSQKDGALRSFCRLVCLSVCTAWMLQSAESSTDVLSTGQGAYAEAATLTEGMVFLKHKQVRAQSLRLCHPQVSAHFCQVPCSPGRGRDEGSRLKTSP